MNKKYLILAGFAALVWSVTNSNNANAQPSNDNNQPPTYTPPPLSESQEQAYQVFLQRAFTLNIDQLHAHNLAFAAAYDQRLPLKYRREPWVGIFNQIKNP